MKTILFLAYLCSFTQQLSAQKLLKYTIKVDSTKEYKYQTSQPGDDEYCYMVCSDFGSPTHPTLCKDTMSILYIVYRGGNELYSYYYDHHIKEMVCPSFESDKLKGITIDSAWLAKHARSVSIYFESKYSYIKYEYLNKSNAMDSLYFLKEWALFERFLDHHKHIEALSVYLDLNLTKKYLNKELYLPPSITHLKKLKHLEIYLEDNGHESDIVQLPPEILKIRKLSWLALKHHGTYNGLEQLKTKKKIKTLSIRSKILSEGFPLWLYDMNNLEGLSLSCCFIDPITNKETSLSTIPDGISKLKKLRTLSLGLIGCAGSITHLPVEELCSMKKLKSIHVYSMSFFKNKTQIEQLKKCLETYYFNTMY